MRKKLLLVNPVNDRDLSLSTVVPIRVPPLGLGCVAALTPPDWDVRIVDENIEEPSLEDADLVGITAFTSNAPRAYEVAAQQRAKGATTVMGGVHASMLPDEAIEFVDSVVMGEAESAWPQVLSDFESKSLKRLYRGRNVSLDNHVRHRAGLFRSEKYRVKSFVETARGCPMDCEFCSVTALHGRTYRQRPVDDVLEELEGTRSREVLFVDDNILGYGREAEERAARLFQGMIDRGLDKRWACQVGIDFANRAEVMTLARKAGCMAVFIGFESLNEESLQSMHKVRNLKVGIGKYTEVIDRIRCQGILVSGAFVFGNDGDREDVFEKTTEFILRSGMDGVQLSILTPLPGTRLYARLRDEGRLLRTRYPGDWRHYGFTEAVFRPKHMTTAQLEEGVTRVYKDVSSIGRSLGRAIGSAVRRRSLYAGTSLYLYNRGYRSFWLNNYRHKSRTAALSAERSFQPLT